MKNILFVLLIFSGLACNQQPAEAQAILNPAQFEAILAKDKTVQLVDVRTPEEYSAGHIQGAKLINFYDADWAARMKQLDKEKPVLVYCAVGGRSGSAAKQLSKMGFKKVYDLAGGINAWRSEGKKTVQ